MQPQGDIKLLFCMWGGGAEGGCWEGTGDRLAGAAGLKYHIGYDESLLRKWHYKFCLLFSLFAQIPDAVKKDRASYSFIGLN